MKRREMRKMRMKMILEVGWMKRGLICQVGWNG